MAEWTSTNRSTNQWSSALSSPTTGVPYNSDYLYDSVLTYNATEIDYEPVWLSNSRNTVSWTDL